VEEGATSGRKVTRRAEPSLIKSKSPVSFPLYHFPPRLRAPGLARFSHLLSTPSLYTTSRDITERSLVAWHLSTQRRSVWTTHLGVGHSPPITTDRPKADVTRLPLPPSFRTFASTFWSNCTVGHQVSTDKRRPKGHCSRDQFSPDFKNSLAPASRRSHPSHLKSNPAKRRLLVTPIATAPPLWNASRPVGLRFPGLLPSSSAFLRISPQVRFQSWPTSLRALGAWSRRG